MCVTQDKFRSWPNRLRSYFQPTSSKFGRLVGTLMNSTPIHSFLSLVSSTLLHTALVPWILAHRYLAVVGPPRVAQLQSHGNAATKRTMTELLVSLKGAG